MSLKIAVSKGRVYREFMKLLRTIGYEFNGEKDRKLIKTDTTGTIDLIVVKSQDVPLYVENAYADIGIVGKDVIDEFQDVFYELTDLKIGECQLCIAGMDDFILDDKNYLTIATKYPKQAQAYLEEKNLEGKVIKLNGSVELGPILGISDCILDIVETGRTLKENNLFVKDEYKAISSRIISNKIFYKTKFNVINEFIEKIEKEIR